MRLEESVRPLVLRSPWGPLEALWGPDGLRHVRTCNATPGELTELPPQVVALALWLQDYGATPEGKAPPALPLDFSVGTTLQQAVWRALQALTWGETLSYSALAQRVAQALGQPAIARSVRAVASAVSRNPWWVLVPCHRIVGRDRRLRGYAGGLPMKADLLQREGWVLSGDSARSRLQQRTG